MSNQIEMTYDFWEMPKFVLWDGVLWRVVDVLMGDKIYRNGKLIKESWDLRMHHPNEEMSKIFHIEFEYTQKISRITRI